jgi:thiosulfate/3-mercaptopyruvate sulfurtransferase
MTNLVCVLLALLPAGEAKYAKPGLLMEPSALMKPAEAEKVVVLDARPLAAYTAGHVPNAVHVDAGAWAKAFAAGQDRAAWVKRLGVLGLDINRPVVVYDASRNKDAARVWWILRYWGLKDVRLLNGGWQGWKAAGGELEAGAVKRKPTTPGLKAEEGRLARKGDLLAAIKAGTAGQLLDARSEKEYCGETTTAKRNGAMPGARRLEWSDTIDAKTGRFKTAPELGKLFQEAGIDPARPATTYCQSGGRASVLAFVVELMGGKPARNYYRSWGEWGNAADTPVVRPKK